MKTAALVLLVAASSALAACRSTEPLPTTPQPYKVLLLPVEGAKQALDFKQAADDVPLAMTPEALSARIADKIQSSHVFSEVVLAKPADLAPKGDEDEMQRAAAFATKEESDLILRIQVISARMTDEGHNGSTVWSTLTWFMIPLPVWFVKDRTYDTNIKILAEVYDPADPIRPTSAVTAASGREDLDLWDRGLSPYVLVVPPPFLKGSATSVSEKLTDLAIDDLLRALVDGLRTREIPSRFEMNVAEAPMQDGEAVKVSIASRRKLRSLVVEVDGKIVKTWAETGLVEEKDSTPERYLYRRSVPALSATTPGAKKSAEVRVVAEDESGGREVRTLMLGGAR